VVHSSGNLGEKVFLASRLFDSRGKLRLDACRVFLKREIDPGGRRINWLPNGTRWRRALEMLVVKLVAARLPGPCLTNDNALHAHHRVHQTSWRICIALAAAHGGEARIIHLSSVLLV